MRHFLRLILRLFFAYDFYTIIFTIKIAIFFSLISMKKASNFLRLIFFYIYLIKIIDLLFSEKSIPHIHFLLKSAFLTIIYFIK